jgi:hypothetical protein
MRYYLHALSAIALALGCQPAPGAELVRPDQGHEEVVQAWLSAPRPVDAMSFRYAGGGQLLQDTVGAAYSVALVEVQNFELTKLLTIDSLQGDTGGPPRALAALVVPPLGEHDRLQWGRCAVHGRPNPALIAIVDTTATDSFRVIRQAWVAEPTRHGFREVTVKDIACEKVAFGEHE